MKTRHNRWLRYEQEVQKNGFILSEEEMKELIKLNPCLKERHVESSAPGYLISQETFFVDCLKGIGCIYMQTAGSLQHTGSVDLLRSTPILLVPTLRWGD